MGKSNLEGPDGRSLRYNVEGRFARYNLEGLRAPSATTPAQKVAKQRQHRAYARLRASLEALDSSISAPRRLSGWEPKHSAQLRASHPGIVQQIETLLRERRQTNAGLVTKSTYKHVPLPADPVEREAERLRRAVASMRALRQRRREDKTNKANQDLIS